LLNPSFSIGLLISPQWGSDPLLSNRFNDTPITETTSESMSHLLRTTTPFLSLLSFQCLPIGVLTIVASFLTGKELGRFMVLCGKCKRVGEDEALWRKLGITDRWKRALQATLGVESGDVVILLTGRRKKGSSRSPQSPVTIK